MTKILDELPYLPQHEMVTVGSESIQLKPYQLVVWVSVQIKGVDELPAGVPRFPAILDTGCTFSFAISERHLRQWAGIRPELLPTRGSLELNKIRMARRSANVWIHRNRRGLRHELLESSARCLELQSGIAVCPNEAAPANLRLPLLGLRALDENGLELLLNCRRRRVSLREGSWLSRWWPGRRGRRRPLLHQL